MRRLLLPLAVLALIAVGCGGSGGDRTTSGAAAAAPRATVPPSTTAPAAPAPEDPNDPFALPGKVPTTGTAPARGGDADVIRRWSAALTRGDVTRAADYFAQPSEIQNASPVITLRTRADRREFNGTLTCGSVPTRFRAAKGYTIVTFKLLERRGGACGPAVGARAYVAIRVRRGHIEEWYRLTEPPRGPGTPAAPSTPRAPEPAVTDNNAPVI